MNHLDTIAAVSTPYGKGGIAVIRISGEDAISVAEKLFTPQSGKTLREYASSKAIYGYIFHKNGNDPEQIDDGIATVFRAPKSFTGEDTVEISCHGGVLITQKVLSATLSAGARLALAGEFTKRAFINGKMTLTGAEALGDLLDAGTDEQIKLARSGMKGILSDKTQKIYDSLCSILAAIFAHIDYPDEDLAHVSREEMLSLAEKEIKNLKTLSNTYSTGHAVAEGVITAIVGRANAGKSSLYNRIVGRDAAIVTDIEGTTRDVLTEIARLGRVTLKLSDTAGLRESNDKVEMIGIDRARREAEQAELILAVFDGSKAPDESDTAFAQYLRTLDGVKVAIINKSDLGISPEAEKLVSSFEYSVSISAESGDGIEDLIKTVENVYIDKDLDMARDAIVSNARQHAAIKEAIEALEIAKSAIENDLPLEICCSEIEHSMSALGSIDGRTVSEDIVSQIFSSFCVGK